MIPDVAIRLGLVLLLLAAVTLAGRWWQRRSGRVRAGAGGFTRSQLDAVGLTVEGAEAVGLLLGSPTCSPCVAVKRVLAEVQERRPGFRWVDVDAADHLDLADAHHVMRVPTLFVVDPCGRILARTSGVPAVHELVAVLDRESDRTAA